MTRSRTVTAVFSHPERRALVVKSGEAPSCSIAAESELPNFGYEVTSMRDPSEQAVLCLIPHYKIFMFQGHSQPHGIEVNPPSMENLYVDLCQVEDEEVKDANDGNPYKLVYLMGCNNGGYPELLFESEPGRNWMEAFSASCFVGWVGFSTFAEHKGFDVAFWGYMDSGYSVDGAVTEINRIKRYPRFYSIEVDGVIKETFTTPVCIGDTNLDGE